MRFALGVQPSDEIVQRAKDGDREAHYRLYQLYSGPVYGLARRLLLRADLADDVLQETFVEVIQHISGFRGEAPVGMWIRRVAVNKCLAYLRSSWHRQRDGLDDGLQADPPSADAHSATDVAALDLERALAALPPVSRSVVWLHDVEGYTHEEIGKLLGRSTSFSKSRLARAHKTLRLALDGDGEVQSCMQISPTC